MIETQRRRLSTADVERLMADPTAKARSETAAMVAAEFEQQTLSEGEREIAENIFRLLAKDVEVRVREALSAQLKTCAELPHDIAQALASDVESVALPMLKYSEVLSDADLLEIISENSSAKQTAIAQRRGVSGDVADALIDTGNETAVARLVANETADLDAGRLDRVMDSYQESQAISESLSRRPQLPPSVSDRLVAAVSSKMQDYLSGRKDLPPEAVSSVLLQARERAMAALLDGGSYEAELSRLVDQLHAQGRLSPWLVLRMLCMGDLAFFEAAVAKLADVPVQNARILVHDQGDLGLKSVCARAGLPGRLLPAFRAAVEVLGETEYDGGANDRERYVERMIERILTRIEQLSVDMDDDDVGYLMDKLSQMAA